MTNAWTILHTSFLSSCGITVSRTNRIIHLFPLGTQHLRMTWVFPNLFFTVTVSNCIFSIFTVLCVLSIDNDWLSALASLHMSLLHQAIQKRSWSSLWYWPPLLQLGCAHKLVFYRLSKYACISDRLKCRLFLSLTLLYKKQNPSRRESKKGSLNCLSKIA